MTDAVYDPGKPLWSIMTKTRRGTVSVIRDLTLEEVKRIYDRLDPWYGMHADAMVVHKEFLRNGVLATSYNGRGGSRICQDNDIEIREVFGPEGWTGFSRGELPSWPKTHFIYVDWDGDVLPDEYQSDPLRAASYREEQEYRKAARCEISEKRNESRTPASASAKCKWFRW